MQREKSYMLAVTDTLIARSEHGLLYKAENGQFFVICECGKYLGHKDTRNEAQKSWSDHWITRPFCYRGF